MCYWKNTIGSLPEYPNLWPACDFLIPPNQDLNGNEYSAAEYEEFYLAFTFFFDYSHQLKKIIDLQQEQHHT